MEDRGVRRGWLRDGVGLHVKGWCFELNRGVRNVWMPGIWVEGGIVKGVCNYQFQLRVPAHIEYRL